MCERRGRELGARVLCVRRRGRELGARVLCVRRRMASYRNRWSDPISTGLPDAFAAM